MTYDHWLSTEPDYEFEPEVEDDGRDAFIAALRDKITTWQDEVAPRQFGWIATVGDYDLDDPIGRGATEAEAIEDLIAKLEK